jgi:hypothetical protein
MTISLDSGILYTRLGGQPRLELGATSGTELYLRQWDARLTVEKDAAGNVTGVVSHQNGMDHRWPRSNQTKA